MTAYGNLEDLKLPTPNARSWPDSDFHKSKAIRVVNVCNHHTGLWALFYRAPRADHHLSFTFRQLFINADIEGVLQSEP